MQSLYHNFGFEDYPSLAEQSDIFTGWYGHEVDLQTVMTPANSSKDPF
ncbi:MAG: hypothetical protein HZB61_14390 [Nitrospirae bacterium]|nr:hypothetical protein [Nitrospirota bacterium]